MKITEKNIQSKVPIVTSASTVREAIDLLTERGREFESLSYLYVVDDGRLTGVLSVRELFSSFAEAKLATVMRKDLHSIVDTSTLENATVLAIAHDIKAVPVVDKQKNFLGVIDSDTIMRTLHRRRAESLLHAAGIHGLHPTSVVNYFTTTTLQSIKMRLPWLFLGLVGSLVSAQIIGNFENVLETQIVLAAFIPLIVYMADAIGTQTETVFVRNVALEPKMSFISFLLKEAMIGLGVAVTCGVVIASYALIQYNSTYLGLVLGLSLFAATLIAIVIGAVVPWVIFKMKQDPAIVTGPLTTVLQDMGSVTAYFWIANKLLHLL